MEKYVEKIAPSIDAKIFESGDQDGMYSNGAFHYYTDKKDAIKDKISLPAIYTNQPVYSSRAKVAVAYNGFKKYYLVKYQDGTRDLIEKKIFEEKYILKK